MSSIRHFIINFTMATGDYHHNFDPISFLEMRYRKTTDYYRFTFPLQKYHEFFTKTFGSNSIPSRTLKVLDYGCGPVIMHVISAVPYASEIVLADIVPECLDELKNWIKNDPKAFSWEAQIDHVVQNLESKGKEEAKQREAELRKTIKAVVHCDIFQENPIEKGYEGPYDVVMSNLCIDGAAKNLEEYKSALIKLTSLIKPSGKLTMYTGSVDSSHVGKEYSYGVGESGEDLVRFSWIGFTRESLTAILESVGYTDVYIDGCDSGSLKEDKFSDKVGPWAKTMPELFHGFLFVSATKKP